MYKKEGIVPLYLLKKLAKEGHIKAKKSIIYTENMQGKKRKSQTKDCDTILSSSNLTREHSARRIYDCEHTEQLRKKLVRSEEDSLTNDDDVDRAYDFSDVIGSAVKQYANGETALTADWFIGDKIVGPNFNGIALRSMKNPGTAFEGDPQPHHMEDYKNLPNTMDGDWGGVHINSGIPNRAFYLVSSEIGTNNAAVLWYTAWNIKEIIRPNSTFKDAFEAILKAAEMLINQEKLPQKTVDVVKNAFSEVGIYSLVTV